MLVIVEGIGIGVHLLRFVRETCEGGRFVAVDFKIHLRVYKVDENDEDRYFQKGFSGARL